LLAVPAMAQGAVLPPVASGVTGATRLARLLPKQATASAADGWASVAAKLSPHLFM
jgi:hypothetical protein